ncbi:MAG TPA: FliA/WhiG family RNA polymerase sigma factor [Candidatus Eremiobacteraeota bacterium]|nr:FliA/WhiG family RNA polymerase sigma factor [Candidatus Eremiobacteraeota bacterium]
MDDEVKDLWESFIKLKDKENRDILIEFYLPLVKKIAGRISRCVNTTVEFEDLVSDGIFGLIKAINNFDISRGIKFETYATPVIRGSILNSLRALDWIPERIRGKARELEKASIQFATDHGREGTKQELAEIMEMSAGELYELIANLGCAYLLSLNQPFAANTFGDEEIEIMDTISDTRIIEPSLELAFLEQREELKAALEHLPQREKILIEYHYFKKMTFDQIAPHLGVTKQRVSQLHSRALKMLREQLTIEEQIDVPDEGYLWY